jgi:hypothetical protein
VSDLASGSEGKEGKGREERQKAVSSPPIADRDISQEAPIKVVKLEWAHLSLEKATLLPIDLYTVYDARVVQKPPKAALPSKPASSIFTTLNPPQNASISEDILKRAMEDASSKRNHLPKAMLRPNYIVKRPRSMTKPFLSPRLQTG